MSTPASAVFGTQTPQVEGDGYNSLVFLIQQLLTKVNTCSIVRVIACTNAGGVSPAGTVDVQPLINQMTGARIAVPHGTLYKLPYSRLQGGKNAIIIDPEPEDIGIVVFSQRDITTLKNAAQAAPGSPLKSLNPGSFRQFNWSDGVYVGAILGGTPSQYVAFVAGIVLGASVVSTTDNLAVGTGATGSFTTPTGQVVTVQDGIVTNIF
jgi:hypothetical protein